MAAPNTSHRTAFAALTLTVLAGTLFAAGTGRAIAPAHDSAASACRPAPVPPQAAAETEALADTTDPSQDALAGYFARRYLVSPQATRRWVAAAYRAAAEVGLDPLLVLAVIAIESRFNPVAESVMGAKGLMQIIPKFHRDKLLALGGEEAALDPETNILVGARILQEYVYRTGTLEAGLQYYNGAMSDESAQYAQKVFAERNRLQQALRAALKAQHAETQAATKGS